MSGRLQSEIVYIMQHTQSLIKYLLKRKIVKNQIHV